MCIQQAHRATPIAGSKTRNSAPYGLGDMLSQKLVTLTLELEARKVCKNHLFYLNFLKKNFKRLKCTVAPFFALER